MGAETMGMTVRVSGVALLPSRKSGAVERVMAWSGQATRAADSLLTTA